MDMRGRRLKKLLQQRFGAVPDPHYFHGDMEYIRAYYDFRKEREPERFLLDDITWNDLDMDRIYKRINPGRSTSGEQYLYYMLRSPVQDESSYERRSALIDFAGNDPELRLKLELILARLGCTRRADLCRAFAPERHGRGMLLVYGALFLLLLGAALTMAFSPAQGVRWLAAMLIVNPLLHEAARRRVQKDFDTVNYSVAMVFAMRKIKRLKNAGLDRHMLQAYESLRRLRPVLRTGGVSTASDRSALAELINSLTLMDLMAYEFLKNKLGRCHEDVFTIHEHLGQLDAAIAVASYRKSESRCTRPKLRFDRDGAPSIQAEGLVHPLLENAVPNELLTRRPMLITGSNASGKSTYLKTAALAAIMAQSLCTCLAERYEADAFRIYSSMALSDDLLAGESYYIVETKSLKRILDSAGADGPVLCVIDEVLRGTNTVERIAASCEVLRALAARGALCLAATHDAELCGLLEDAYDQFHFEELVGRQEMLFDYKLRPGRASSRNAIHLLRLIGFDESIVQKAHDRADHYMKSGRWRDAP